MDEEKRKQFGQRVYLHMNHTMWSRSRLTELLRDIPGTDDQQLVDDYARDGELVGVYELVEVKTLHVTRTLE